MNFDYIKDAQPKTEELRALYASLYESIEKAEAVYWSKPQKCGMLFRKIIEKICQIYNSYYNIGFDQTTPLENYLCYTSEESHNVMVSRFLSVIRQEQRDRLEWLRVWSDECTFMDENPEEITKNQDKLYINVKKMMYTLLEVTRTMCEKLDHMEELEDWVFEEELLPGYLSEDEREELEVQKKKEERKGIFSFFRKR